MTVQIAVRLPDDLVAALDALVNEGAAPSRASVVERALERELRRRRYEEELEILSRESSLDESDDLAGLVPWAVSHFRIDD